MSHSPGIGVRLVLKATDRIPESLLENKRVVLSPHATRRDRFVLETDVGVAHFRSDGKVSLSIQRGDTRHPFKGLRSSFAIPSEIVLEIQTLNGDVLEWNPALCRTCNDITGYRSAEPDPHTESYKFKCLRCRSVWSIELFRNEKLVSA